MIADQITIGNGIVGVLVLVLIVLVIVYLIRHI